MINLGKIHRNLFFGVFAAFASIPSSLSILSDYILPALKSSFGDFLFGNFLLNLLSLIISIASVIWIKETIEDIVRTSRFMAEDEYKEFMIKTIIILVLAILCGIIVSRIIND